MAFRELNPNYDECAKTTSHEVLLGSQPKLANGTTPLKVGKCSACEEELLGLVVRNNCTVFTFIFKDLMALVVHLQ